MRSFRRQTVSDQVQFSGQGLHSGEPVTVVVKPGNDGISFNNVKADPSNVVDTSRCTRLETVSTIEHLMSAFAALGVTDADVEVDALEMPAMDGASETYYLGLVETGLIEIGERSFSMKVEQVHYAEGDVKVSVAVGTGVWRYEFECGDRWPHSQHFEIDLNKESYLKEVAPARTFAFGDEMEMVRAAGLGKGLDETTAFVIGSEGYINKTKFEDEPARHKMLDLIGDLYLAGIPVLMLDVVASKSGHTANVSVAKKLVHAVEFSD